MCDAGFPVWAMVTFGTLCVCIGFEGGRCFSWLHQLWLDRRTSK